MNDAARAQLERDIENSPGRRAAFPAGRAGRDHRAADRAAGRVPAEAVPDPQRDGAGEGPHVLFSAAGCRRHLGRSGHRSDARSDQALRWRRHGQARRGSAGGASHEASRPAKPWAAPRGVEMQSAECKVLSNSPGICICSDACDQHPHPPRSALLPVSVDARRRDHRARGRPAPRGRQERHGQRGILPGPFPRGADAARRADARVAVAGGGDSAAAARRRAAQRPHLSARRERREVPPAGRAGRPAAAGDLARPPPRLARAGAGGRVRRRSDRRRSRSPARPGARPHRRSIRPPSCIRRRRSARGRRSGRSP